MFKKIMLATSPHTLGKSASASAFSLAREHGAELVLFHSLLLPEDVRGVMSALVQEDQLIAAATEEIEKRFAAELKTVPAHSVLVTTSPAFGEELLSKVCRRGIDLVVMDSLIGNVNDGRKAWGGLGANVEHICANTVCPIMLVRDGEDIFSGEIRRIVMATDFSTPSEKALEYAALLARTCGARLFVFHVLDMGLSYPNPEYYLQDMGKLVAKAHKEMERRYVRMLKDVDCEILAWEGIPYVEVMKCARWNEADLIVMAHQSSERASHKTMIGSTVVQVALSHGCPVLIMNYLPRPC